jgi:hypothetical protein
VSVVSLIRRAEQVQGMLGAYARREGYDADSGGDDSLELPAPRAEAAVQTALPPGFSMQPAGLARGPVGGRMTPPAFIASPTPAPLFVRSPATQSPRTPGSPASAGSGPLSVGSGAMLSSPADSPVLRPARVDAAVGPSPFPAPGRAPDMVLAVLASPASAGAAVLRALPSRDEADASAAAVVATEHSGAARTAALAASERSGYAIAMAESAVAAASAATAAAAAAAFVGDDSDGVPSAPASAGLTVMVPSLPPPSRHNPQQSPRRSSVAESPTVSPPLSVGGTLRPAPTPVVVSAAHRLSVAERVVAAAGPVRGPAGDTPGGLTVFVRRGDDVTPPPTRAGRHVSLADDAAADEWERARPTSQLSMGVDGSLSERTSFVRWQCSGGSLMCGCRPGAPAPQLAPVLRRAECHLAASLRRYWSFLSVLAFGH